MLFQSLAVAAIYSVLAYADSNISPEDYFSSFQLDYRNKREAGDTCEEYNAQSLQSVELFETVQFYTYAFCSGGEIAMCLEGCDHTHTPKVFCSSATSGQIIQETCNETKLMAEVDHIFRSCVETTMCGIDGCPYNNYDKQTECQNTVETCINDLSIDFNCLPDASELVCQLMLTQCQDCQKSTTDYMSSDKTEATQTTIIHISTKETPTLDSSDTTSDLSTHGVTGLGFSSQAVSESSVNVLPEAITGEIVSGSVPQTSSNWDDFKTTNNPSTSIGSDFASESSSIDLLTESTNDATTDGHQSFPTKLGTSKAPESTLQIDSRKSTGMEASHTQFGTTSDSSDSESTTYFTIADSSISTSKDTSASVIPNVLISSTSQEIKTAPISRTSRRDITDSSTTSSYLNPLKSSLDATGAETSTKVGDISTRSTENIDFPTTETITNERSEKSSTTTSASDFTADASMQGISEKSTTDELSSTAAGADKTSESSDKQMTETSIIPTSGEELSSTSTSDISVKISEAKSTATGQTILERETGESLGTSERTTEMRTSNPEGMTVLTSDSATNPSHNSWPSASSTSSTSLDDMTMKFDKTTSSTGHQSQKSTSDRQDVFTQFKTDSTSSRIDKSSSSTPPEENIQVLTSKSSQSLMISETEPHRGETTSDVIDNIDRRTTETSKTVTDSGLTNGLGSYADSTILETNSDHTSSTSVDNIGSSTLTNKETKSYKQSQAESTIAIGDSTENDVTTDGSTLDGSITDNIFYTTEQPPESTEHVDLRKTGTTADSKTSTVSDGTKPYTRSASDATNIITDDDSTASSSTDYLRSDEVTDHSTISFQSSSQNIENEVSATSAAASIFGSSTADLDTSTELARTSGGNLDFTETTFGASETYAARISTGTQSQHSTTGSAILETNSGHTSTTSVENIRSSTLSNKETNSYKQSQAESTIAIGDSTENDVTTDGLTVDGSITDNILYSSTKSNDQIGESTENVDFSITDDFKISTVSDGTKPYTRSASDATNIITDDDSTASSSKDYLRSDEVTEHSTISFQSSSQNIENEVSANSEAASAFGSTTADFDTITELERTSGGNLDFTETTFGASETYAARISTGTQSQHSTTGSATEVGEITAEFTTENMVGDTSTPDYFTTSNVMPDSGHTSGFSKYLTTKVVTEDSSAKHQFSDLVTTTIVGEERSKTGSTTAKVITFSDSSEQSDETTEYTTASTTKTGSATRSSPVSSISKSITSDDIIPTTSDGVSTDSSEDASSKIHETSHLTIQETTKEFTTTELYETEHSTATAKSVQPSYHTGKETQTYTGSVTSTIVDIDDSTTVDGTEIPVSMEATELSTGGIPAQGYSSGKSTNVGNSDGTTSTQVSNSVTATKNSTTFSPYELSASTSESTSDSITTGIGMSNETYDISSTSVDETTNQRIRTTESSSCKLEDLLPSTLHHESAICPCRGRASINSTGDCAKYSGSDGVTTSTMLSYISIGEICPEHPATFDDTLSDPSSELFKTLAGNIVQGLYDIRSSNYALSDVVYDFCVTGVKMLSGSILASVKIEHDNSTTPSEIESVIQETLESESLALGSTSLVTNTQALVEVNECEMDTHECHIHAKCMDEQYGYACSCKLGYRDNFLNDNPGLDCFWPPPTKVSIQAPSRRMERAMSYKLTGYNQRHMSIIQDENIPTGLGSGSCARRCTWNSACVGYNYAEFISRCELVNMTISAAINQYISEPGYNHYQTTECGGL